VHRALSAWRVDSLTKLAGPGIGVTLFKEKKDGGVDKRTSRERISPQKLLEKIETRGEVRCNWMDGGRQGGPRKAIGGNEFKMIGRRERSKTAMKEKSGMRANFGESRKHRSHQLGEVSFERAGRLRNKSRDVSVKGK